jgi:hypothetical protein
MHVSPLYDFLMHVSIYEINEETIDMYHPRDYRRLLSML